MPRRDFSKVAFAATGDTNAIPTPTQPDGSISLQTGWGFDYQRDNGAGGGTPDPLAKNIDREDMNGILNEITASIGEIQQNGMANWAATAAPYPINAEVRYTDNLIYRSSIANNNSVPGVGPDWVMQPSVGTASTTLAGLVQLATNAQMAAGVSPSLVPSVAAVMSIFAKRAWTGSDFIRIPDVAGGLIIQWASGINTTVGPGLSTTQDVNFPIVFPNAVVFGIPSSKFVSGAALTTFESPTGLTNSKVNVTTGNPTASPGTSKPLVFYVGY